MRTKLTELDTAHFAAPLKFSFVSVMGNDGYPHTNLITTLEAKGDNGLMFAENYYGRTKTLLAEKKEAGFLVLGLDMNLWTGTLRLRGIEEEGPNKEYYNDKPSSRYNAYFIYHRVYLCDLLGIEGPAPLDLAALPPMVGAILPQIPTLATGGAGGPLTGVVAEILGREKLGKFLAWQGADGIPRMAPLFGAVPAGTARMVFPMAESPLLAEIPEGAKVTLHCLQMTTMQGVQLRGDWHAGSQGAGYIDVAQVYNPMPPRPNIVYPSRPYATITEF